MQNQNKSIKEAYDLQNRYKIVKRMYFKDIHN
jgi:hypothetical protein